MDFNLNLKRRILKISGPILAAILLVKNAMFHHLWIKNGIYKITIIKNTGKSFCI